MTANFLIPRFLPMGGVVGAMMLTLGCVPAVEHRPAPIAQRPAPLVQRPAPRVRVAVPVTVPPGAVPRPPQILATTIAGLGRSFDGVAGIAVRDVQAGWVVSYNGTALFPQQSVSKLWVAIAAMDAIDRGALSLSAPVTVTRADFTVFHQPIRALVGAEGYRTTIDDLIARAMTQSDNTANDMLLRRVGGPDAVREVLARKGITGIAFGPGERLLQSRIAGLEWRPEYAIGQSFYQARSALPLSVRTEALNRYLANPMDGAQPEAIAAALASLRKGELLSPASTQYLLSQMAAARTGPQRVRGGVSPDWAYAHKTGTGQELGGLATGYNDVGLLTAPDGRTYAIAVMIGSTRRGIPERQRLMQAVARAVIDQYAYAARAPSGPTLNYAP
jgi:beta-lactamase class A